MKIDFRYALAGVIFLFAAGPAMAGAYGALATSPNADFGWSKNYDTQDEAEDRALSECRKYSRRCTIKKTFKNICVSVASSSNGAMGWTWGYNRGEGNRRAVTECTDQGGKSCKVVARFCTGDADYDN